MKAVSNPDLIWSAGSGEDDDEAAAAMEAIRKQQKLQRGKGKLGLNDEASVLDSLMKAEQAFDAQQPKGRPKF